MTIKLVALTLLIFAGLMGGVAVLCIAPFWVAMFAACFCGLLLSFCVASNFC